jgi:hypothetical protein
VCGVRGGEQMRGRMCFQGARSKEAPGPCGAELSPGAQGSFFCNKASRLNKARYAAQNEQLGLTKAQGPRTTLPVHRPSGIYLVAGRWSLAAWHHPPMANGNGVLPSRVASRAPRFDLPRSGPAFFISTVTTSGLRRGRARAVRQIRASGPKPPSALDARAGAGAGAAYFLRGASNPPGDSRTQHGVSADQKRFPGHNGLLRRGLLG